MAEFRLPPVSLKGLTAEVSEIPWGVQMINAPKVWEATKGAGVVVAILDTGIDTNHPDLAGTVIGGKNFTDDYNGDENNFQDNQGHGTHCAGTVAGISNARGVVGVAPEVKLLIGKVLDHEGSGSYEGIVNGIRWATQWRGPKGEKVRVISMSLGGPQSYGPMHTAIKEAIAAGILVVCAAGNEGDGSVYSSEYAYPGAYPEVVEVGAVDSNKRLASFSNTNNQIDVVAPGVDVLSTIPGGQYAKFSGTSMATPHVSAAAALLIAMHEKDGKVLTEPEIYQLLIDCAVDTLIDTRGEGKGLVILKAPQQAPVEQPAAPQPAPIPTQPKPAPAPVQPTPVPPRQEPTPQEHNYKVTLRKVGSRYAVEVGGLLSIKEAGKLADALVADLNTAPSVVAKRG